MRTVRRWWPPVVAAGIMVLALTGRFWAGEDKNDKMENKDLDKKIGAVVKTVINRGADMHNVYRDTAGCYRFYQGSLTTLRPLLDGHPDLQKAIDTALADANRAGSMLQRGLILNRALHRIYNKFNPKAKMSDKDKKDKDVDKGPEDKAPRDESKKDKDKAKDASKKDKENKDAEDKDEGDKDAKKKDKDSKKDKDADKDQGNTKDKAKDKDSKKDKDQAKRDLRIPKDLLTGLNKG